jgi:hypothetical protein
MKTFVQVAFFTAVISLSAISCSHKTRQVGQDIKNVADTVGNKTAEIAAKGAARVTDKVYANKVGPEGQTIYIDKNSKYFYIDSKGHRVFVKEADLKDKTD